MEQIVSDFNSLLLDLCNNVADICPDCVIGANIAEIRRQLKKPENMLKFIDIFVGKVLLYKDKIDAGDESFFLNKSYDSDVGDQSLMSKVFEFKSIWVQLKPENKTLVIQYMQLLCQLAQQYFVEFIDAT